MKKAQIIRHGEVILKPIEKLPEGATLENTSKKIVVAHSETGHHHILEGKKDIKVYMWNGEMYLEVSELSELWHQKTGKDIHTPHPVTPSATEAQAWACGLTPSEYASLLLES